MRRSCGARTTWRAPRVLFIHFRASKRRRGRHVILLQSGHIGSPWRARATRFQFNLRHANPMINRPRPRTVSKPHRRHRRNVAQRSSPPADERPPRSVMSLRACPAHAARRKRFPFPRTMSPLIPPVRRKRTRHRASRCPRSCATRVRPSTNFTHETATTSL